MASPQAYEQPTINRAWEDFIAHIPTMLLIWIASVAVGVWASLHHCLLALLQHGLAEIQAMLYCLHYLE